MLYITLLWCTANGSDDGWFQEACCFFATVHRMRVSELDYVLYNNDPIVFFNRSWFLLFAFRNGILQTTNLSNILYFLFLHLKIKRYLRWVFSIKYMLKQWFIILRDGLICQFSGNIVTIAAFIAYLWLFWQHIYSAYLCPLIAKITCLICTWLSQVSVCLQS